jgi:hypothetical protein
MLVRVKTSPYILSVFTAADAPSTDDINKALSTMSALY